MKLGPVGSEVPRQWNLEGTRGHVAQGGRGWAASRAAEDTTTHHEGPGNEGGCGGRV